MWGQNLQDAISELIAKGQADRRALHASEAESRLAKQGGDSREIAILITETGAAASIDAEAEKPAPKDRPG